MFLELCFIMKKYPTFDIDCYGISRFFSVFLFAVFLPCLWRVTILCVRSRYHFDDAQNIFSPFYMVIFR